MGLSNQPYIPYTTPRRGRLGVSMGIFHELVGGPKATNINGGPIGPYVFSTFKNHCPAPNKQLDPENRHENESNLPANKWQG